MKSKTLVVLILLTALAIPVRLIAREQKEHPTQHHRYKLVDLGTFGGPASYINPASTFGSHNQINRRGAVVGGAATSIPTTSISNLFVCGGLDGSVPFVNHAFQWRGVEPDDLGALARPENCSIATSINTRGEIAGTSENGSIDPVLGVNQVHAVLWKDAKIQDLGTLGGADSSGDAINNRGQVVGFAFNAIPDPLSFIYFGLVGLSNGTQTRAFLWERGVMQDLGTLGGPDAVALFVNERGQVAGFSYTNSTPNPTTGLPTIHPFVWTPDDGMKDLGSLGGTLAGPLSPGIKPTSESGGFNNRGQFVGIATVADDQTSHPFLWDGTKLIDLFTETTGGTPLSAADINDAGEVVGGALFPNRILHAFLWRDGMATDLGTVDRDGCSWAGAINSHSQVVGQSFACDGSSLHAFLWESGSMIDLNNLIPSGSKMQLVDPVSINDRGEIAGIGLPPGCTLAMGDAACGHAFVLIPCDDNQPDEQGCEGERETTTAAIQDSSVPVNQSLARVIGAGLTPREVASRMRRRFGQNRPGAWSRK